MAVHESTINVAPGFNSTDYTPIKWSSFDSGANNLYFDVSNRNETKMVILLAGHSTLPNRVYVGTCDSRSSQTSKVYPYAAGALGRTLIKTTAVADGDARSKFRSTVAADTEVFAIYMLGPFETMRYADSRGYVKMCRGITTAGGASHSSNEQHVAAILLP